MNSVFDIYLYWRRWFRTALCLALCLMGLSGCDSGEANKSPAPRVAATNAEPASAIPASTASTTAAPFLSEPLDSKGVVAVQRAADTGFLSLRIDEAALTRIGDAVHVQVRVACKYLPARNNWQRLPASPTRIAYRVEPRSGTEANAPERLLYEMPRETGLYWVLWIEEREREGVKGQTQERQATGTTDTSSCAAPRERSAPGMVMACVPGSGEAQWLPDPAVACAELR